MKKIIVFTQQDAKRGVINYSRRIEELKRENARVKPFSERGWLEVFPEAEPLVIERLREYKKQAQGLKEEIKDNLLLIYKKCKNKESIEFWKDVLKHFKVDDLNKLLKEIKELSWALMKKEDIEKYEITNEMIEAAKKYPFENLIEANKAGFAVCPFHKEEKPSFYIKNNFGYCFGCNWNGDTIQFVMEKNKLNFMEAVRYLLRG